jgi:hypothetical protein
VRQPNDPTPRSSCLVTLASCLGSAADHQRALDWIVFEQRRQRLLRDAAFARRAELFDAESGAAAQVADEALMHLDRLSHCLQLQAERARAAQGGAA